MDFFRCCKCRNETKVYLSFFYVFLSVWLYSSFVSLFVCSFVSLFVCSFVSLFVCSFVSLFVCLFLCSFLSLFVCSFVSLFICSFLSLFAYSLLSFFVSCIFSFVSLFVFLLTELDSQHEIPRENESSIGCRHLIRHQHTLVNLLDYSRSLLTKKN